MKICYIYSTYQLVGIAYTLQDASVSLAINTNLYIYFFALHLYSSCFIDYYELVLLLLYVMYLYKLNIFI